MIHIFRVLVVFHQIIQPIDLNGLLSEQNRRVTFYAEPKHWVDLVSNQFHHVDFYFLESDMKTVAKFLPMHCEINLDFKRDKLF